MFQCSIYDNVVNRCCYFSEKQVHLIKEYMHLKEVNEDLIAENVRLRNEMTTFTDSTLYRNDFKYDKGVIVNATYNRTKNFLTLDKGEADGIRENMGICSGDDVVGMVVKTSDHYSIIMPVINKSFKISGMLKKGNYYGSMQWDGIDYRYSYLEDIPMHIGIIKGDSVVTTEYSSIFPKGKFIGYVDSVCEENSNFKKVKIRLAVDFRTLNEVNVISNLNQEEKKDLEKDFFNE